MVDYNLSDLISKFSLERVDYYSVTPPPQIGTSIASLPGPSHAIDQPLVSSEPQATTSAGIEDKILRSILHNISTEAITNHTTSQLLRESRLWLEGSIESLSAAEKMTVEEAIEVISKKSEELDNYTISRLTEIRA